VEEAGAIAGSGAAWGAGDGINGRELWLSSGTAAGTVQMDLNPGRLRDQGNSYPGQFTRMGSTTYFVARNAEDGNELWKTDGTVAGTQMVHDIATGTLGGNPDIHGLAGGVPSTATNCG
jgi:ELWxxDGT repeat protein